MLQFINAGIIRSIAGDAALRPLCDQVEIKNTMLVMRKTQPGFYKSLAANN